MKPIYFPFTYISNTVAKALHACLGKPAVYQPSKYNIPENIHQLAKQGVLDIRFSGKLESKDEKNLSAILKEYAAWGNLHQGGKGIQPDFFKVMRNQIPFFDDTSASQIKADIKDITGVNSIRKKTDPVFNARIFLNIAQNFDIQNDEITQEIASFETARKDLIKSLRAEDETSPDSHGYQNQFKTGNLPDYDQMAPERIAAWTLLMCNDQVQRRDDMSSLFVTSSRQAIDYLLEKTPEIETILSLDAVPSVENSVEKLAKWSIDLLKYLKNVAETPMPVKCDSFTEISDDLKLEKKVSLSIYLIPGVSPLEYFSPFSGFDSADSGITKDRAKLKNTLMGYIGFSD